MLSKYNYLTEEEKSLKLQIEQEITELFQLCGELCEKRNFTELECHNRFQEIRRRIDIRREEAKQLIDVVHMEMIEVTKKLEANYIEHMKKTSSFTLVGIEEELNSLGGKFRNPQFQIESIKSLK